MHQRPQQESCAAFCSSTVLVDVGTPHLRLIARLRTDREVPIGTRSFGRDASRPLRHIAGPGRDPPCTGTAPMASLSAHSPPRLPDWTVRTSGSLRLSGACALALVVVPASVVNLVAGQTAGCSEAAGGAFAKPGRAAYGPAQNVAGSGCRDRRLAGETARAARPRRRSDAMPVRQPLDARSGDNRKIGQARRGRAPSR